MLSCQAECKRASDRAVVKSSKTAVCAFIRDRDPETHAWKADRTALCSLPLIMEQTAMVCTDRLCLKQVE